MSIKLLNEEKILKIRRNQRKAIRHADAYVVAHYRNFPDEFKALQWSAIFHEKMDELCKKDGVRV